MPCSLDCHDCINPSPSVPADYSIPGFGIQLNCRNAKWALVVRTAESQENWVQYRPRHHAFESMKAATALRYQGKIYRLMEVTTTSAGWTYRFIVWPTGEPLPTITDLAPGAMNVARATEDAEQRAERLSVWAPYYEFLFGFLPARVQVALSERYCFNAEDASRKSGLVQFLVSLAVAGGGVIHYFTSPARADLIVAGVFAILTVEGIVRWGQALVSGEPIGFFLLELPYRLLSRSDGLEDAKK